MKHKFLMYGMLATLLVCIWTGCDTDKDRSPEQEETPAVSLQESESVVADTVVTDTQEEETEEATNVETSGDLEPAPAPETGEESFFDTSANTDHGPSNDQMDTEIEADETTDETRPPIDYDMKENYKAEFTIFLADSFDPDTILVSAENAPNTAFATSVYERTLQVENQLGVTIAFSEESTGENYAGEVFLMVISGADDYQLVLTPSSNGVSNLMVQQVIRDLSTLQSINIDGPCWAKDLMDEVVLKGKYMLGYNDMCLPEVDVIMFNKTMETGLSDGSLYDLVRGKTWTLATMNEIAALVCADESQGEQAETIYGITGMCGEAFVSLVTASDIRFAERKQDGTFTLGYAVKEERIQALAAQAEGMFDADYSRFWTLEYEKKVDFSAGNTLFQLTRLSDLRGLDRSEVSYGVLPYPLFDEEQDAYRSLIWNGFMGVPETIMNSKMVGDVLELLAYYSQPVITAYYEELIGADMQDVPDDAEMLEIIRASQVTDMGAIAACSNNRVQDAVYVIPDLCKNLTKLSLTSHYIASFERNINSSFDI